MSGEVDMSKFLRVYKDFSGGLSEVANDNMLDNELVYAKNIVPGDATGLACAPGTVREYPQIEGGNPVIFFAEYKPLTGDKQLIACTMATVDTMNMYKFVGEEWVSIAVDIRRALDWFFAQGKLYWLNGNALTVYDGSLIGAVAIESELASKVHQAVAVVQRGSRWFYATANNEVIFSEIGYVNKFSATSLINVGGNNADTITALHEFNDGILIFQQRTVYMLTGWDLATGTDIELRRLNVSCGTKWPKSICTVDNAVLYFGSNGIYQLNIAYLSAIIESKNISAKKIAKRLDIPSISDVYAVYHDNTYYLSLKTADSIIEYRYYPDMKAFFGEYTQEAYCYISGLNGSDDLFIGCANGYILRYDRDSHHYIDTSSGSTAPIEMVAQTKGFDVAGAMVRDAKIKRAFVVVKQYKEESSKLTVQIKADYADQAWDWQEDCLQIDFDESLVYGEGILGSTYFGWMDSVTKEINVNQKAKRIQFILHDAHVDNRILVYGVGVLYKKKKVKGSREGVAAADVVYDE